MEILYKVHNNLYVNLTNRCPYACTFCLRQTMDRIGESDRLWLEREPSYEEVIEEFKKFDMDQYGEVVFCGFGEPMEAFDLLIKVAAFVKETYNKPIRINTNGSGNLINGRNIIPEMKGLIDCVSISLNHPDKEQYQALVRSKFGDGSYDEMIAFASYAFNKSHATCYSWVAYQTAYLKAHYPADYMAAVLTSGQTDITRTTQLMAECKRMGISVLPPSVNESELNFSVNSKEQIHFGLQAISGMGEAAANCVIAEREKNGPYKDIFDFLSRVDLRTVNRKNVEVLVKAGAFDGLGEMHRAQYFVKDSDAENAPTYLERIVKWAAREHEAADSSQMSIFDMAEDVKTEDHPPIPQCQPWTTVELCRYEKDVVGFYLSGHPLDDYKYEMRNFAPTSIASLADLSRFVTPEGKSIGELKFAGIVTESRVGVSQRNGDPFGIMTIEDYTGSYDLRLFKDEYQKFKSYFEKGLFLCCRANVTQWTHTDKDGKKFTSPPRLHLIDMTIMSGLFEKYVGDVCFEIELKYIDDAFVRKLEALAKKYKGNCPLIANIHDTAKNISLTMKSKDLRVSAREMLYELEKIDKSFTNEFSVTGVFKEDVDILRPIITIESNVDLTVYNYFTMNNRTYHITSCELLTGGLYRINAAVDVLTTYSTGIKSLEIIADKVQQKTFSTQDINDESHINASGLKRELKNFDIVEGNSFTEYPNLILITIGGETT